MRAKTRIFGEIDIPQDKIITMEKGMIGFSELKNYTLIYNSEKENDKKSIMWLQSMDDGDIAFPVMTPDIIMPDYKPTVNEELLAPLGDLNEENMYVIVTVNVPSDITKIACNLKAPIVVNTDSNKANDKAICQTFRRPISAGLKIQAAKGTVTSPKAAAAMGPKAKPRYLRNFSMAETGQLRSDELLPIFQNGIPR